ncbi:protein-glutamate O-methyltransferase CheR [Desulfosporosinus sp. Sb-LF]|uniref:CheR family methyltransferase n=1 Tax=Desulfosporosinus sp. Sb-LF TaxID=2560027 RepID=UPI00107F73BF|nr:protein-glutamate O-methyltransferase CheR [Desulfosporosinus sp. Sb-LF]TGE33598.1 protein-glutamate O-methyltransferase CheR [Desulfosporosinus sp. Sb-LF]
MIRDCNSNYLESKDIEIQLLLEAIYLKYGYDFRDYSKAHLKRRIMHRLSVSGFESISQMQYQILYDRTFLENLLTDFSINVTEMFRDPPFYKVFRQEVIPVLKTYPFIKIWHAGCSSGEEVYSMAILLKEEGLYERTQIYATDFNVEVLAKAKQAIYPIDDIKDYTYNYQQSGGLTSFADYYIAKYDSVILDQSLKDKIIFADHNLVTDGVFGEMHVVICRNVLIYFNRELQNKVFKLFYESLRKGGFLGIGTKESLRFSNHFEKFKVISEDLNIYQKKFEV